MAEDRVTERERLPELKPAEAKRGRPPGSKNKAPAPEVDLSAIEAGWQGLWLILRVVLGFFGWESDVKVLPQDECREDAKALRPVVQRFPGVARVLSWIGAPVVIVQRVLQHFKRKAPPKAKETPGATVGKASPPAA